LVWGLVWVSARDSAAWALEVLALEVLALEALAQALAQVLAQEVLVLEALEGPGP
jgi:hypothetical protein